MISAIATLPTVHRSSRLPEDATVVVRPSRRAAMRERVPTIAVFALTTLLALFGIVATGTALGAWTIVALLGALGVVSEVLALRSEIALGPVLAADAEHLWIRVGGVLRPESVRLDWTEVAAVTVQTWQGRRGATSRYLAIGVGEAFRATLDGMIGRRLRRLAGAFGSPLAISEKNKATPLDETVRALREVAPADVRFTTS